MKLLFTTILFFIFVSLSAQIEILRDEEYRELIFSVQGEYHNAIGTAFIVGKNESHYFLATARHVLNGAENATLTSLDGTQHKASLVREHDVHDLALLKTKVFPLEVNNVPVSMNLYMNEEVVFVSAKDEGKILPSKKPGIIRDITDESLSLIMNEVDAGHSGSPIFSQNGIAGIIVKNGRFIQCINILLVKRIIDSWAAGLFEDIFIERRAIQIKNLGRAKHNEMNSVSVIGVQSTNELKHLKNLIDGDFDTIWSYLLAPGEEIEILILLEKLASLGSVRIHVPSKFSNSFPAGSIYFVDSEKRKVSFANFSAIFKEKERSNDGYWFVYSLPEPELAENVLLKFSNKRSTSVSYGFNEVQFFDTGL